eukprot:294949-Pleurochrysis_carterae.AAC.1
MKVASALRRERGQERSMNRSANIEAKRIGRGQEDKGARRCNAAVASSVAAAPAQLTMQAGRPREAGDSISIRTDRTEIARGRRSSARPGPPLPLGSAEASARGCAATKKRCTPHACTRYTSLDVRARVYARMRTRPCACAQERVCEREWVVRTGMCECVDVRSRAGTRLCVRTLVSVCFVCQNR